MIRKAHVVDTPAALLDLAREIRRASIVRAMGRAAAALVEAPGHGGALERLRRHGAELDSLAKETTTDTGECASVVRLADVVAERERWPKCDECGGAAEIVCASPRWEAQGFVGTGERAAFCCRKHTEKTAWWYWFWIIDAADRDDDCMTLWSRDSITHIARKTWGPPFLAWLLACYDLSTFAEAGAREEAPR